MSARTATGPQNSLKFEYDWQGRRVRKQVFANTNWTSSATNDLVFAYDAWNLIAQLDSSHVSLLTFLWGLDLSGSMQGAGGVGGLLAASEISGGSISESHFAVYDGNGNVVGLVKGSDGTMSARYEYGLFGELLRTTGTMAKNNTFRFSTKYQDNESDNLCYPYRYYSPNLGRWLSRDMVTEFTPGFEKPRGSGGIGAFPEGLLVVFVNNAPSDLFDAFGFWPSSFQFKGLIVGFDMPLTHQKSIERAIKGLTSAEYEILKAAQVEVDNEQDLKASFKHAMRYADQSAGSARQAANDFVRDHLEAARQLLCPCPPNRTEALHQFGLALHTIQDATSPAHTGFQVWNGTDTLAHKLEALDHVGKEDYDPGASSQLDKATAWAWTFFVCPLFGGPDLPTDFFASLGSDPPAPPPPPRPITYPPGL
jgi:RHS repeat-associated protein